MSNAIHKAVADIAEYNAYQLANMADVHTPDSLTSPGAEFLLRVLSESVDRLMMEADDYGDDETERFSQQMQDSDWLREVADDAPSIWNYTRMQELVDLAAWDEDVSDFGEPSDIITAAGWALYGIANRLIYALIDDVAERAESYREEDEEGEEDES